MSKNGKSSTHITLLVNDNDAQKFDKVVESAYGRSFNDDSQRVAYLFEMYQKLCGELFVEGKKKERKRRK